MDGRMIVSVYSIPLVCASDAGVCVSSLAQLCAAEERYGAALHECGEVLARALACVLAPPLAGTQALSDLETMRAEASGRLRQQAATVAVLREQFLCDLARLVATGMVAAEMREGGQPV